jgi:arylamine N-acetyltransferase
VQHRIAAKPTPEGRLSLFDNELKIRRHDETITHAIHDEAEFRRVLVDYFGLVIEGDFVTQSTFK